MKVVIVGGVAGGASTAARLRRLDEHAEIVLLERGEYISYANCGLPYYIGGEIKQKSALFVMSPEDMRERMDIDVRTRHEAIAIDPAKKTVEVRETGSGNTYTESYDKLVLSPGAQPIRPPFPGENDERVFTLRTVEDTFHIHDHIKQHAPKAALVVGGGYIGMEMAENLSHAGLAVTVAELANQTTAPLDYDMAVEVHHYAKSKGINLLLENGVRSVTPRGKHLDIELSNGALTTDMVLLSIGVQPENGLAENAGLATGARGAIVVDSHMRTSDPDIYALGDVVQSTNPVSGLPGYIPLAGPANKQGRIVADNLAGIPREYKGTQGTAILKFFDLTIGSTGLNERMAAAAKIDFDKVYVTASSHAGYYPCAMPMLIKVLFENGSGRILGAQLIGMDGVDKRLDVLATAIRHRMDANDLADLELAYAPPYSSAKDPVNIAGFLIQNLTERKVKQFYWTDIAGRLENGAQFVDMRSQKEYANGHIEGAQNLPLDELRLRLGELDKTRPIYVCCQGGQRSYAASRILAGNGFDVRHLAGGYRLYASAVLGESSLFTRAKRCD